MFGLSDHGADGRRAVLRAFSDTKLDTMDRQDLDESGLVTPAIPRSGDE